MSNVFDNLTGKYARYYTTNMITLSNKIKSIYNSNYAYILNSGIHATSVALDIIISNNKDSIIIYPTESYYENIELIEYKKKIYNIDIYNFNILDNDKLFELLNNNKHKIIFFETCINPYGYILDYSLISKIKSNDTTIIVDNTWLSGHIFNPFYYGIDIVTESITKHYSGNTEIAGCCVFNDESYDILFNNYIKFTGIHTSPNVIKYINDKIDDSLNRLFKISETTFYVIDYLLYNNIYIYHPSLFEHPCFITANNYFNNNLFIGTFLIGLPLPKDKIKDILKKLSILEVVTSFGCKKTRLNNVIYNIENNDFNFIRLSIGYDDDINRIIYGLNEFIHLSYE